MSVAFKVVAKTRPEFRANRHGVRCSVGGRVVAEEQFQFPDTPFYLACEMVQDEHPGCDLAVVVRGG